MVVSDGSRSYQAAFSQYLPDAQHVLDRFHVARWFTEGLTQVRRELQRRDPRSASPDVRKPDLFRARFTLLRREDHLTDGHRKHLERLFKTHPRFSPMEASRVGQAWLSSPGRCFVHVAIVALRRRATQRVPVAGPVDQKGHEAEGTIAMIEKSGAPYPVRLPPSPYVLGAWSAMRGWPPGVDGRSVSLVCSGPAGQTIWRSF